MIRLIFLTVVLFILFVLAYINQDIKVSVALLGGSQSDPIPVYFIIIGSFLVGTLLATLMMFPGWVKLKLERRRLEKRIERLEGDLDRIRSETLKGAPPPSYPRPASEPGDLQDDPLGEG
ncbi:MAG TPA: LapA family protein [Candidatus Manganitrophaceae bacterium]|nr:LapA family protein [Candidatus Manganitrophaceae bacterium]